MNTIITTVDKKDLKVAIQCSADKCPIAISISKIPYAVKVLVARDITHLIIKRHNEEVEHHTLSHSKDITNWIDYYDERKMPEDDNFPTPIKIHIDLKQNKIRIIAEEEIGKYEHTNHLY